MAPLSACLITEDLSNLSNLMTRDPTCVLRGVHHRPCDQSHEQQLAPGLLLLQHLPGSARRCGLCQERRQVSLTYIVFNLWSLI